MGKRKTGSEPITFEGKPVGQALIDFWSWNASDLLDNTLRGEYAEFIVASALGLDLSTGRISWEPWDLTYPYRWQDEGGLHEELHIEVKSCSYIQSWKQSRPSSIIFGIRPTRAWSAEAGYSEESRRQSDVYVFCLYAETDGEKADPLVLDGWEFYVVPTSKLNEQCGAQKTISLPSLQRLCPIRTNYAGIKAAVCQSIQTIS